MVYLYGLVIIALGSFLWRVRGGLDIWNGGNVPANKVWYSVYVGIILFLGTDYNWVNLLVGTIASYTGYQLYGLGKYVGALVSGVLNKEEKECELIDDLLDPCRITVKGKTYWLKDYAYLYGLIGTCLTGLIMSFTVGLAFQSIPLMISGVSMGFTYGLTTLICNMIGHKDSRSIWSISEWVDGAVRGLFFAMWLL